MLFACIFVPDFPMEAIVRSEPELRDHAVVAVEGSPQLLRVVAANEPARATGVEVGMTKLQAAARLTTGAAGTQYFIRRRSPLLEAAAAAALVDCARSFSPRVEQADIDTVLLDLAGLDRLFGSPQKMSRELAQRAFEVGLETHVGVAANLDAAICAARGFSGSTVLPAGKEAERLASLPIEQLLVSRSNFDCERITPGRAQELLETLDRWGVRTFRALTALPSTAVSERLGPEGIYLQALARGRGPRTLAPTELPLTFVEAIELEDPLDNLEPLWFVLNRLIDQLCARLAARALSTNELDLQMEIESLGEYEIDKYGSAQISTYERQDSRAQIHNYKLTLPVPMLDAKTFLRLFQLQLRTTPPAAPVTKIWLRAEPVQPRYTQGGLFLPSAPEPEKLELTLARLREVVTQKSAQSSRRPAQKDQAPINDKPKASAFGLDADRNASQCCNNAVRVGSTEILDTHRPDAFRINHFVPQRHNESRHKKTAETSYNDTSIHPGTTALRVFRPPLAVNVEVRQGHPIRLLLLNKSRNRADPDIEGVITWAAGPWRISGEWWNEMWSRDEWDIAVKSGSRRVLCRLYRDTLTGSWFLEGVYD